MERISCSAVRVDDLRKVGGPVPPFDASILNGKGSLYLTRPSLAHYVLTREELLWRAGDVLLIDNMLTAHGRNPFSGKRSVVVGMSQESA